MEVLRWPENILALILDVDETVYERNSDYNDHQRQIELAALAQAWEVPVAEATERVSEQSSLMFNAIGRKPSAAEVIRSFGFRQDWLAGVRSEGWQPERFLKPDPRTLELFLQAEQKYRLAFATTSPRRVAEKVLSALRLSVLLKRAVLCSAEDAVPKPDPAIYRVAAERLQVKFEECMSIGDRLDFDALPALNIGMGAVVVSNLADLHELLQTLCSQGGEP